MWCQLLKSSSSVKDENAIMQPHRVHRGRTIFFYILKVRHFLAFMFTYCCRSYENYTRVKFLNEGRYEASKIKYDIR